MFKKSIEPNTISYITQRSMIFEFKKKNTKHEIGFNYKRFAICLSNNVRGIYRRHIYFIQMTKKHVESIIRKFRRYK